METTITTLQRGDFVRVKTDAPCRPGQDGMVMSVNGDQESVGLVFGFDRHNCAPSALGITYTGLTEAWRLDELDLASIER